RIRRWHLWKEPTILLPSEVQLRQAATAPKFLPHGRSSYAVPQNGQQNGHPENGCGCSVQHSALLLLRANPVPPAGRAAGTILDPSFLRRRLKYEWNTKWSYHAARISANS